MKVLDSKTVVVSNSDELKEILEEDNTYSYIWFRHNFNRRNYN